MNKQNDNTQYRYMDTSLSADERARDLVKRLTLSEKILMMASRQMAVPRLGIPEFHIGGEAAHGLVAHGEFTTVFPQTHGLACTWDDELLEEIGKTISDEARAIYYKRSNLGGLCLWAPTIDMERDPRWGRTEEAYGEDPLLAALLAGAFVKGMQGDHGSCLKTVPSPKHFYANNNEYKRGSCSASISPRLRHEYYLKPFEILIRRFGAKSMMTAYNAINGTPAMVHRDLLELVKGQWQMNGFIVSDGGAFTQLSDLHGLYPDYAHAIAAAIKAGVDNLTDEVDIVKQAVSAALDQGLLNESHLDRALENVFRVRMMLGQFDPPETDPYKYLDETLIWDKSSKKLALKAAEKSIVLLKNSRVDQSKVLPLDPLKLESLALIGPLASVVFRDWYTGKGAYSINPLSAIIDRLGAHRVNYTDGSDYVSFQASDGQFIGTKGTYNGIMLKQRPADNVGELFRHTDWGFGNHTFQSLFTGYYLGLNRDSKLEAAASDVWGWHVKERFALCPLNSETDGLESGAYYFRCWNNMPVGLDENGVLTAILERDDISTLNDLEEIPRDYLSGKNSPEAISLNIVEDGIAKAVKAAKKSEVAVVFLGSHPLLSAKEEIDRYDISLPPAQMELLRAVHQANPKTVAVLVSGFPYILGDLADKIPAILYMAHGGQEAGNAIANVLFGDVSPAGRLPMTWYKDMKDLGDIMDYDIVGANKTYRYFSGEVHYPFGYGLSYLPFDYKMISASTAILRPGENLRVTVDVANLGSIQGEEVVQLYKQCESSALKRPLKELAVFKRISIPGKTTSKLVFELSYEDFQVWDPVRSEWFVERGIWTIMAGPNSAEYKCGFKLEVQGCQFLPRKPFEWNRADSFLESRGILLGASPVESSSVFTKPELGESFLDYGLVEWGEKQEAFLELLVYAEKKAFMVVSIDEPQENVIGRGVVMPREKANDWQTLKLDLALPGGITKFYVTMSDGLKIAQFRFVKK